MSSNPKTKIIASLQGWRAIMIMMIFILHVCPDKIPLLAGGYEVISFFMILSGFVLGMSSKEYDFSLNGIREFVGKHIKKFYPLHMLMLVLCALLNFVPFLLNHDFFKIFDLFGKFLADSILVQAFIPKETWYYSLNRVSWYLSATLFFYIIFIPIYHSLKDMHLKTLRKFIGVGIILHLVVIALMQYNDNFSFYTYIFPVFRSIEFIIGIILGILYSRNSCIERKVKKLRATLLEIAIVFIFLIERILCTYTKLYEVPYNYKSFVGILIAIGIVYVFAYEGGMISEFLSNRFLVYIGNISFEIFIIHTTIKDYCNLLTHKYVGENTRIIITIILTLMLASIFHFYVFNNKSKMRQDEND